ncbi:hypothetical protein Taro_047419 [Colocasia esculenta]|uniref:WAT1-related protein n=1 Tax=Colocasia esculenta TaxID=4460 RepID=A0A843X0T8_COLES|nr:hypothetical protein [Colocasia esculenta]
MATKYTRASINQVLTNASSVHVAVASGQAWIVGDCPSQLTSTAVTCWMGTIQTALVALLFEKPAAWRLNWNLELLTISYSGIFCSALGLFVQMWCVKVRGPVFTTVFSPLATVMVAILEPLLINVPLHWGSLTGIVMVIGGLYSVLWGKAKEEEEKTARASGCREPLLTQSGGDQMCSATGFRTRSGRQAPKGPKVWSPDASQPVRAGRGLYRADYVPPARTSCNRSLKAPNTEKRYRAPGTAQPGPSKPLRGAPWPAALSGPLPTNGS